MSLKVNVSDGFGTETSAKVTSRGELVVGNSDYSVGYAKDVDTIDTAFNFVGPVSGKRFVITDILLSTDRNIGNNGATILIYEATADDTVTVTTTILQVEMLKNTSRDLTGLNLIVTEGVWVNVKTNDDNVFSTLMGYYVKA